MVNKLKSVILYFLLLILFFLSQFLFNPHSKVLANVDPGPSSNKTEITKDFDVRTNSSMTEEKFNEAFKGGVLEGKYQIIVDSAKKYGINAGFMSAIMLHESGRGKSDMIKEINNPGGLTCA